MRSRSKEILADISELLHLVRPDIGTSRALTADTVFCAELNLTHVEVVSLIGRLRGRYRNIDLTPFFIMLSADFISTLRAGQVVEHVGQLLDTAEAVPPSPDATSTPRLGQAIVISNGRSGSTLLSDLLAEQSETVVPQEFFRTVGWVEKCDEVISGAEYWALLNTPPAHHEILGRVGMLPKEYRYPDNGRWAGGRVPPILKVTLPSVCADPDSLYDALAQRIPGFPRASVARHHETLLELLCTLTGRKRWVERSGASTLWTPQLLRFYPQARIVYLTRNPADVARSMSKHPSFQLDALRSECIRLHGFDPFDVRPGYVVPEEAHRYLPDRLTAQELLDQGRDLRHYVWVCAYLTNLTEQALTDAPPAHLHAIRYEDLLRDPVAELGRLGRFMEFDDWADWAARTAGRVKRPAGEPATPGPR